MPIPFDHVFVPRARNDGPDHWSDPVLTTTHPRPTSFRSREHHRPVDQRLIQAAVRYDLTGLEQALAEGADPNVHDLTEGPVLRAVLKPRSTNRPEAWDPRLVRALLEAGADPSVTDRSGTSMALMAWQYSHNAPGALAATRWLVKHPWTDVTQANQNGSSMIAMATYAPELIPDLVTRGENIDRWHQDTSALGASLRWGVLNEPATVRAFGAAGVNPNAAPAWGRPALPFMLGSVRPREPLILDTVQALLDIGADPYWRGAQGETLDDLIRGRAGQHDALYELLAFARHRADNRRLNKIWRASLVPTAPHRSRARL